MHERGAVSFKEQAMAEVSERSPLESALINLADAQESADKAVAVLADRLQPVLQPEEPSDLASIDGEKSGVPQSVTLRRLNESAADLRRLAHRVNRLMDRMDV